MAYLLRLGTDIDHSDEDGYTALHHAALRGFKDTVETLVIHGANVEAQSTICGTPLHLAASRGHTDVLRYLLDCRASPEAQSKLVGRPLHCACFSGSIECAGALLAAGAGVASKALVEKKTMEEIAAGSPTLRKQNFYECEPLLCAILGEHMDLVDAMLEAGASIDCRCIYYPGQDGMQPDLSATKEQFYGRHWTALHIAAATSKPSVCRALLSRRADVDALTSNRKTPLIWAVWAGNVECVELLLDFGADTSVVDDEDFTALGEAIRWNSIGVARRLIQRGASLDWRRGIQKKSDTLVHYAVRVGTLEIMTFLLDAGAPHDAGNGDRETPLDLACRLLRQPTVNRLKYGTICEKLQEAAGRKTE